MAAPASGATSEPQRLGGSVSGAYSGELGPALAIDRDGDALAVAGGADGGLERLVARPGSAFGAARPFEDSVLAVGARVALSREGTGVVAWLHDVDLDDPDNGGCCVSAHAAMVDDQGRMGEARELPAPGTDAASIGVGARGSRAAVAWVRDGEVIVADASGLETLDDGRSLATESATSPPEILAVTLPGSGRHPHVIVQSANRIVELWRTGDRRHRRTLLRVEPQERYFDSGLGEVASAPAGHLLMTSPSSDPSRIRVAYRRPGERLRRLLVAVPRPRFLSRPGPSAGDPAVALSPTGAGLLGHPSTDHIYAVRTVTHRGRLGAPRHAWLPPGESAFDTALAVDATGRGVLATFVDDHVRTWRVPTGGSPRYTGRLRPADNTSGRLTAATEPGGAARVLWTAEDELFAARVR